VNQAATEGDSKVSEGWKSRTTDYRQFPAESELLSYSTGAILALHWGTLHRTIRQKTQQSPDLGAEQRHTADAFVEELAGVSWHRFAFGKAANRTYQHGFQNRISSLIQGCGCLEDLILASWLQAGLLLYPQNRVLCRLGDSEFDDSLSWNLDLLLCLRVEADASLPFLLYELTKSGQDEFAVLFDRFVGEVAERIEKYSGDSFVGFGGCGECELEFGLGHV
jgi:hypothetical protein